MWVLKPIWAYVNTKCGSRMPRNRSVKAIHYPSNCKPLSEIEQNLFQELGSAVYWSDGYTMLIGYHLEGRPWVEIAVCQHPGDMALRMR